MAVIRGVTSRRLRTRGLRATAQRRAILAVFDAGGGHLSAEDVLERARVALPELSRATVYNTLREFVTAGLVRPIAGWRSHLFEADGDPHEHFQCRSCGLLYDVHLAGRDGLAPAEDGFAVRSVLLEGTCPSCTPA